MSVREIVLTPDEKTLYGQLFRAADSNSLGVVTGEEAVTFFAKTGLPPQTLAEIWQIADTNNQGFLTQQGFNVAVKLIAHAQNGEIPSLSLMTQRAPLPKFDGFAVPARSSTPSTSQITPQSTPLRQQPTGTTVISPQTPIITDADRARFAKMFANSGAVNGLLDGEKARQIFMKSNLPMDKLGQIWALSDIRGRGALDLAEFTMAMYLIQYTMNGSIKALPPSLPPSFYEMIAGRNIQLTRQFQGMTQSPAPSSPLKAQYTGQQIVSPQSTGGSSIKSNIPWDISPTEKLKYDANFDAIDTTRKGYIVGDEAVRWFMASKLPGEVLAHIWDLSDITKSGRLNREEFAVAMHLINLKLSGAALPPTLPSSLVPLSMRKIDQQPGPTSITDTMNDLFSLMEEPTTTPSTSANIPSVTSAAFVGHSGFGSSNISSIGSNPASSFVLPSNARSLQQPPTSSLMGDLLGDVEPEKTANLTGETVELAHLNNQEQTLTKSTTELKDKRNQTENNLANLSSQRREVTVRLQQIRALYDAEAKVLAEVEASYKIEMKDVDQLRRELIAAEAELSRVREEKLEQEENLRRDRSEINQMKARLQVVSNETKEMRDQLEKVKKEARQQRGLVAIHKKQLTTAEADREKIFKEFETESNATSESSVDASVIPAPPAPHLASSTSGPFVETPRSASLNPFERISAVASPTVLTTPTVGADVFATDSLVTALPQESIDPQIPTEGFGDTEFDKAFGDFEQRTNSPLPKGRVNEISSSGKATSMVIPPPPPSRKLRDAHRNATNSYPAPQNEGVSPFEESSKQSFQFSPAPGLQFATQFDESSSTGLFDAHELKQRVTSKADFDAAFAELDTSQSVNRQPTTLAPSDSRGSVQVSSMPQTSAISMATSTGATISMPIDKNANSIDSEFPPILETYHPDSDTEEEEEDLQFAGAIRELPVEEHSADAKAMATTAQAIENVDKNNSVHEKISKEEDITDPVAAGAEEEGNNVSAQGTTEDKKEKTSVNESTQDSKIARPKGPSALSVKESNRKQLLVDEDAAETSATGSEFFDAFSQPGTPDVSVLGIESIPRDGNHVPEPKYSTHSQQESSPLADGADSKSIEDTYAEARKAAPAESNNDFDFESAFADLADAKVAEGSTGLVAEVATDFEAAFPQDADFDETFNPSFDNVTSAPSSSNPFPVNFGGAGQGAATQSETATSNTDFGEFDFAIPKENPSELKTTGMNRRTIDEAFGTDFDEFNTSTGHNPSGGKHKDELGFNDSFNPTFDVPPFTNVATSKSAERPPVPPRDGSSQKLEAPDDDGVKSLVAMGFTREQSISALEKHNYNVEEATNFLLDHNDS